jgi:hypothetical protein
MSIDVEYGIKKDIRNNPVVREIDRLQKREFLRTLALTGAIVGMLLFSAWQHFNIVRSGMDIERLRQQHAAEAALHRQLRLELEMHRAPQFLEQRATRELRMVMPSLEDTIVIERVPAPAPAPGVLARAR